MKIQVDFPFIGADPFMELIGYGDKCQLVRKIVKRILRETLRGIKTNHVE